MNQSKSYQSTLDAALRLSGENEELYQKYVESVDLDKLTPDEIRTSMRIALDISADRVYEAESYQDALKRLFKQRGSIGQAILAAMWHVYSHGLIQYLGEYNPTPEDFMKWVHETYAGYDDEDYLVQLGYIVTRILQEVHTRAMRGHHFTLPTSGERVTIDMLLNMAGNVTRLRDISATFVMDTVSENDKTTLLDAAVNYSTAQRREARNKVRDGYTLKLPYRETMSPDGQFYTIILENLTGEQTKLFYALVGDTGEQVFS